MFLKNNIPPSKVQKVIYFSITLPPLKMSIHLNISLFGSSLGNHISFSASTNKTNLLIGCPEVCEDKLDFFVPGITEFVDDSSH